MSQHVLDGVRDLLPTIRSRAEEAERLRVVPDASIKELEETGFFRLLQPKRYGGFESDPVDFYTAVREIASACGSTGWVSSVVGVHPWQVALFPDEAQQAVWGEDTSTRLSSSYAPTGKAKLADGGYRLELGDATSCERAEVGDDVATFTVQGLALAWSGAQSCANLRLAGHLSGPAGHDRLLDALLRSRPVHVRDYF